MNARTLSFALALAFCIPAFGALPEDKDKPDELTAPAEGNKQSKKHEGVGKPKKLGLPKDKDWAAYEQARLRMLELGAELRAEQAKAGAAGRDEVRKQWLERHKAELEDYQTKARALAEKGSDEQFLPLDGAKGRADAKSLPQVKGSGVPQLLTEPK
jgi:hypothetical protein